MFQTWYWPLESEKAKVATPTRTPWSGCSPSSNIPLPLSIEDDASGHATPLERRAAGEIHPAPAGL